MTEFNLKLVNIPALHRIDSDVGPRLYKTPDGNKYPSVTSVLGSISDNSGLDDWRNRVGEAEANKVMNRSARRGTRVHELCEKLILNQKIDPRREMPLNLAMYRQLEGKLISNVNNILGCESMLYSDKLKLAGTADLIADWNGDKSIIDFKTSAKEKQLEWIDNYFLQASFYSYMFWERTNIMCPNLVVMIALEEGLEPQVFTDNVNNWIDKAFDARNQYYSK